MPNHFHFLIYVPYQVDSSADSKSTNELEGGKSITAAIAIILRSYTRAINKQRGWTGSLFQQRTKSKNLSDGHKNYAVTCFHYIHQNPCKAGLSREMTGWEFNSYLDYAGLRNGTLCDKEIAYTFLNISLIPEDFIRESNQVRIDYEF